MMKNKPVDNSDLHFVNEDAVSHVTKKAIFTFADGKREAKEIVLDLPRGKPIFINQLEYSIMQKYNKKSSLKVTKVHILRN